MRICAPVLAALFVSLMAAPALADGSGSVGGEVGGASAATTVAAKPPPTKADPDEIICKYQQTIGSRIPSGKVCRTRSQWEEISNRARDATGDMQERGDTLAKQRGG